MESKMLLLVVLSAVIQYTVCMSTTTLTAASSSSTTATTSSTNASDPSLSNMSTTIFPDSSVASDFTSTPSPNITEQSTIASGTPSNQSLTTQTESPTGSSSNTSSSTVSVSETSSESTLNQSLTQTESPMESSSTTSSSTKPVSESSSESPKTSKPASSSLTTVTTSPIVASNTSLEEVSSSSNISDTTTSTPIPVVNILDSAFFLCGINVFQNVSINAGFLFPPSDNNMPNISSITNAEQLFNISYQSFCGELVAFTHCVKETLQNDPSETDTILKRYIDMDNLDTALDVYCNNNDNIPSQLQCTVSAVERSSCPYGGIMGISKYVMNAIQTAMPKDQYCAGLKESIRCRVDKQLKNCGTSYAETMDIVYTALTGKYCK